MSAICLLLGGTVDLVMWDRSTDARALAEEGVEVWTPVIHAPENYCVSNLGRACSNFPEKGFRFLKTTRSSWGYLTISFYVDKERTRSFLLHKVVIESFDGLCTDLEKTDVRHTPDDDPGNCYLSNLQYGTRSENMRDVWRARELGRTRLALEFDAGGKAWTWYDVPGEPFLQAALNLYGRGKLTKADLAELWGCTTMVVETILTSDTFAHLDRPEPRKGRRMSPEQVTRIRALITQGKNRDQVNTILDLDLTDQAFWYYKQSKDHPGR
jgi:hypothetical protein